MYFRTTDERPFTVPRPGLPWLLPAFVVLSLLLHSLLFIAGDNTAPLDIEQPGNPYIHAILSNEPASNDNLAPNTAEAGEKPPAAEIHETPRDRQKPDETTIADRREEIAHIRESLTPSAVEAKIQEPLNTTDNRIETPSETAITTTNDRHDTGQQALSTARNSTQKSTQSTARTDTASQRNHLLGQLQDQLSRYLVYPLRARRRGWEGEVLLSLRLDAHGQLHDIQLLRSSGYAVLDRSALQALSRLDRLHLPTGAPRRSVDLQLPVVYRLSEG